MQSIAFMSKHHLSKALRPNSYVVLLPSHCRVEPNKFYCFSTDYNRLDLVRHGSGTTYEFGLNSTFKKRRGSCNSSFYSIFHILFHFGIYLVHKIGDFYFVAKLWAKTRNPSWINIIKIDKCWPCSLFCFSWPPL